MLRRTMQQSVSKGYLINKFYHVTTAEEIQLTTGGPERGTNSSAGTAPSSRRRLRPELSIQLS